MGKWYKVKRKTAPDGPGPGRPRKAEVAEQKATRCTHEALAQSLWSEDYDELFKAEAAVRPELVELFKDAVVVQASTWRQQRRASAAAAEQHEQRMDQAAMQVAAQARRLGNQLDIPLLVAARSLSWLMTMARCSQWKEEQRLRRLLHRTTTTSILHAMTACAPPPPFHVNKLVQMAFVDQTYMQNMHYSGQGARGSRAHVRVERLDDILIHSRIRPAWAARPPEKVRICQSDCEAKVVDIPLFLVYIPLLIRNVTF